MCTKKPMALAETTLAVRKHVKQTAAGTVTAHEHSPDLIQCEEARQYLWTCCESIRPLGGVIASPFVADEPDIS
ncbi:MAG: hypothetical protein ACLUAB_10720 [Ruminococcus sp.]